MDHNGKRLPRAHHKVCLGVHHTDTWQASHQAVYTVTTHPWSPCIPDDQIPCLHNYLHLPPVIHQAWGEGERGEKDKEMQTKGAVVFKHWYFKEELLVLLEWSSTSVPLQNSHYVLQPADGGWPLRTPFRGDPCSCGRQDLCKLQPRRKRWSSERYGQS